MKDLSISDDNIDDISENDDINKFQIIKYPYESNAINLIDQFLVLGFQKNFIKKEFPKIIEKEKHNLQNKNHIEIAIEEKAEVLNEINFKKDKQFLSKDLLINIIFPNNLQIIIMNKNTQKEELLPYKVIFSFKSNPIGSSLIIYKGLAYIFYLMFDYPDENIIVFYQMAYCIISEFPYFTSFSLICQEIRNYSLKEIEYIVPIEILIYNIVNFTPSPIKNGIKLLIGGNIEKNTNKQNIINNMNDNPFQDNSNSDLNIESYKYNNYHEINFQKLSGYPLIDFNLSLLFNLLPVDIILKTFICTFLEEEIVFYSENIETLNMIMYIFSILNYPVNDINYYQYILSVSANDYKNGNSMFTDKPFSSMIGVNSQFNIEIEKKKRTEKFYFVLDIGNKTLQTIYNNKYKEEEEKNACFYNYIDNIINEKNKNKNINFLEQTIINLYKEIIVISKKVTSSNLNLYKNKIRFLKNPTHPNEVNESFQNQNKEIQQIFYSFILNFFDYFYSNCTTSKRIENNSNKNPLIFEKILQNNQSFYIQLNEPKAKDELEKLFIYKFNKAMKINSYVINFLLGRESLDLYKIPFIFTEEFIYWLEIFENRKKELNENNTKKKNKELNYQNSKNEKIYFNLIDKLYEINFKTKFKSLTNSFTSSVKRIKIYENPSFKNPNLNLNLSIHHSSTMKNKNIDLNKSENLIISFENFLIEFDKHLCQKINREQYDSIYFVKKGRTKTGLIKYNRRFYDFDNDLLKKYKYMLNQYAKNQLIEFFPSLILIEDNNLKESTCPQININNIIEDYFLERKLFSLSQLILYSISNIIGLTISINNGKLFEQNLEFFIDLASITEIKLKKPILLLSSMVYRFMEKTQSKNEEEQNQNSSYKNCFKFLYKYINNKHLIPNEEFLSIINKLDSKELIENNERSSVINSGNYIIGVYSFKYFQISQNTFEELKKESNEVLKNNILSLAENTGYNGVFNYHFIFKENISNVEKSYEIWSPKKVYCESSKILNQYYESLNMDEIDINSLINTIVMTIFYVNELPYKVWNQEMDDETIKEKTLNMLKSLYKVYLFYKNDLRLKNNSKKK